MFGTGSIQMTPLWTLETALYSRSQKRADLKMMSKIDFFDIINSKSDILSIESHLLYL